MSHLCARIGSELARISKDTPIISSKSEFQRWCPILARYSFHTPSDPTLPDPWRPEPTVLLRPVFVKLEARRGVAQD